MPSTELDRAGRAGWPPGPGRAVLGVTGSPGAGKSTLVAVLLRQLAGGRGRARADGRVPPGRRRAAPARAGCEAKGAPDTFDAGGYVALLRRMRADAEDVIYAPAFERDLEQPLAGAIAVPRAARLVLTEGNYLLVDDGRWAPVRAELAEVWFCDPDPHGADGPADRPARRVRQGSRSTPRPGSPRSTRATPRWSRPPGRGPT